MKILLVTYEYPPDCGGIASYLGGLFGSLLETRVLKIAQPSLPLAWLLQLPKILQASRDADIVVVSHLLPLGTAAMLSGKPYAVIVHGLDLRLARRKSALAARVLKRAKRIIANSRATASELAAFGVAPSAALVLTPAIDPSWKAFVSSPPLFGTQKTILAVGRFVSRKGFDRLIRLLPKLRECCGDVRLVLAGAGPEEGRLRSETEAAGMGAFVRFVIAPDRNDLAAQYAACDLFVLPVRPARDDVEGFGIVCLEAAVFAKPVVATRIGGLPEAVEDGVTGFLVDPDSDEALRERLSFLLTHPETAARLGSAGRARVLRDFEWPARREALLRHLA